MEVWVKSLDGKNIKIDFIHDLLQFKTKVALVLGIPTTELRLVGRGKELQSDSDL